MSLARRVSVYLEKTRNSSVSPSRVYNKPKSPGNARQAKILQTTSKQRNKHKNHLVANADKVITENSYENMIDSFLKARYGVDLNCFEQEQSELPVISEIEKLIQMDSGNSSEILRREDYYMMRAESMKNVIKHKKLGFETRMSDLRKENLYLKQKVAEKNLENLDKKLELLENKDEHIKISIFEVIERIANKENAKELGNRVQNSLNIFIDNAYQSELFDEKMNEISENHEMEVMKWLCRAIKNKTEQFDKKIKQLDIKLREMQGYSQFLSQKLNSKSIVKHNLNASVNHLKTSPHSINNHIEDDELLSTSAIENQETSFPDPFLNASQILDSIYEEVLQNLH
jgi:hypothetical protein